MENEEKQQPQKNQNNANYLYVVMKEFNYP